MKPEQAIAHAIDDLAIAEAMAERIQPMERHYASARRRVERLMRINSKPDAQKVRLHCKICGRQYTSDKYQGGCCSTTCRNQLKRCGVEADKA